MVKIEIIKKYVLDCISYRGTPQGENKYIPCITNFELKDLLIKKYKFSRSYITQVLFSTLKKQGFVVFRDSDNIFKMKFEPITSEDQEKWDGIVKKFKEYRLWLEKNRKIFEDKEGGP